ncbi:MAG: hypothetical protein CMH70_01275 [Nitrosomonadaceae bacterium]|mgnify:CR=1 FL=1|nr:hypothetical protein [Nitrosomonadaceae bacterium]|tara:strand:- start:643 stop:1593 length:951 start_codon:yes stop_codon:yes gene_type:complete
MLGLALHHRWITFCLTLFIAIFFSFPSFASERLTPLNLDKTEVSWTKLSFKGKEFFAKLNAEVKLTSSSEPELNTVFIPSSEGIPIEAPGLGALVIDTRILIKSIIANVELQKIAWFHPVNLSAMQYVRQRIGFKDSNKVYRFTNKGVFRVAKQPINKSEALQLPEEWSARNEQFYPYPIEVGGCPSITVPMSLIYLISASKMSNFNKPVTVCVFNKKETVYLDIKKEPAESVQLNHIELKRGEAVQKNILILADVLSLKARSITSGKAIDNFTLIGLQGNIKVYVDRMSRIPVQLTGDYKSFGQIQLNLYKVIHN